MTRYERYERFREALAAQPSAADTAADGPAKAGWHHQDAALAMAKTGR